MADEAIKREMILRLSRAVRPVASHVSPDEMQFQDWYRYMSQQHDLPPNPDDTSQHYDYRSAYRAGAKPDETGHWPSDYKQYGHPNMVVGGYHVQTGEPVPGHRQAGEEELVRLGWDRETAKRLSTKKVDATAETIRQIVLQRLLKGAP